MLEDNIHQRRLAQYGLLVVVSNLCIGPDRLPVRYAAREHIRNVSDSGWILRSGSEDPDNDDPKNYSMVPFERMVATDESLKILYDQPVGTELTRKDAAEPWRWIIDNKIVDEDGRIITSF